MSNPISLFPPRIAIGVTTDGRPVTMSPEFYRALRDALARLGGQPSTGTPQALTETWAAMVVGQDEASRDFSVLAPFAADAQVTPEVMASLITDVFFGADVTAGASMDALWPDVTAANGMDSLLDTTYGS